MDTFLAILEPTAKWLFIALLFALLLAGLLTWAERRQSSMIQDRRGPNRANVDFPILLFGVLLGVPVESITVTLTELPWQTVSLLTFDPSEVGSTMFPAIMCMTLALFTNSALESEGEASTSAS